MKFATLATLATAATVASAATLEARQVDVCSSTICSISGTVDILGTTAAVPTLTTACCAGTTCGTPVAVTTLPDLTGLLGSVEALLGLLGGIPALGGLLGTVTALLTAVLAVPVALVDTLLGPVLTGLGTVTLEVATCS